MHIFRTFLHEKKKQIAETTDGDYGNAPKGLPQALIFQQMLKQAEVIVSTRSTNLTNEQRSAILRSLSGTLSVIEVMKVQNRIPETSFLLKQIQELEDINWLNVN